MKKKLLTKPKQTNFLTPETSSVIGIGKDIIGRTTELEELKDKVDNNQKVVVVNGMGGIGKTTLAKYFIDKYHTEYTSVLWINGVNGIEEGFWNSDLLHKLNLFKDIQECKSLSEKFDRILNALRSIEPAHSLLILDNIDKKIEKSIFDKIQLRPNWKVILTSRRKFSGYELYPIKPLSEDYCVDLFFKNYTKETRTTQNIAIVRNIIKALYRHTLTIELLAKTTEFNLKYNLKTLWNEIQENGLTSGLEINIDIDYNRIKGVKTTISKCLNIAFLLSEFGNDKFKLKVLSYLSILPPNQIEYEVAKKLFKVENDDELKFIETLNFLYERGWIEQERNDGKTFFYMHPMIQHTIRKKIKPNIETLSDLVVELSKLLSISGYENKSENVVLYTPFVENTIAEFEKTEDLSIAHLCYAYSQLTRDFYGDKIKSVEYAKKALSIRLNKLPENHDDLIASYNNCAISLRHLGNNTEAYEFVEKAITILENRQNKTEEDFKNLATYNNTQGQILKYFRTVSHIEAALDKFQTGLSILKENNINHPHLEAALNDNIGNTYNYSLEQFVTALPYLQKAVKLGEATNDPHIFNYYNNIAGCYLDLDKLDEAEFYIKKVIANYESMPFKDTNANLAIAYKQYSDILLGKFLKSGIDTDINEALEYQNKAIFIKEKNQNIHSLAISYNAIAKILNAKSSIQNNEKALEYALIAVEVFKQMNSLLNLKNAYDVLVSIYNDLGRIEEKNEVTEKLKTLTTP